MKDIGRPETIENRWDILYRDYPEVYDEFTSVPYSKSWIEVAKKLFSFGNKTIADIGSGSGISTFEIAGYARLVIGIEPEDAMRELAVENAKAKKLENVIFKKGWAESIPLDDNSVDAAIAVTGGNFSSRENISKFISEAERITKRYGYIIAVNVAPRWYGGDLAPVILGKGRTTGLDIEGVADETLTQMGFSHQDYYSIQYYRTVDKIVQTYGFIFGRKAIKYVKEHQKTTINWKFRIHYREV
ncbi:MAG TPA: class I SAM-dependent methyltransferase [Dehalococcoidia bacterium]|nr:class I SAM-dependent methyltransferase [Dehalococcoidia bacterium]